MKNKEDISNDIVKEVNRIIISTMLGISAFVFLDIFFWIYNFSKYPIINTNFIFVFFWGILTYSLIFAISGKSYIAIKICYITAFIIGVINQIKLTITTEPIYLSDIQFIKDILAFSKVVTSNVSWEICFKFLISLIPFLLILLYFFKVSKKNNINLESKKIRISIIILDIIILLALIIPNYWSKNIFLKLFFDNDKFTDYNAYGNNLHYYMNYGCTSGIYGVYLNSIFFEPDNYDEKNLNDRLNEVNINDYTYLGTPNIVVIFSESFWDVEQLDEIKFNKKITENFQKLKEQSYFVNLISPTYGGMSENTAFEFLTGASMNYFPSGYIPISSLYNRKSSENIPSLVKILKNVGYKTKTTFVKDYYNSEKAYMKMGIDEYIELIKENSDINFDDKYITDIIIEELSKNKEKLFTMYSTYENHMPFYKEKYNNYDVYIEKSNLSDKENETLQAYAQGIYNSDKQLGRLYDAIQQIESPTIVIFMSDHLPYLYSSDYSNVIDKLDYFNTDDETINLYRKYNTQCLIFSNYDLQEFNIPKYYGVNQVLTYIVNRMDLKKEKFYQYLESTTENIVAYNKYISIDKHGNLYLLKDFNEKMRDTYNLREMMQYKFFIK